MQISKNNKRLVVQISVIVAIPLILLALIFVIAVLNHNEQAAWFYSIGEVAGAIYFRQRADEALLLTIISSGLAMILLIIAFYIRREY